MVLHETFIITCDIYCLKDQRVIIDGQHEDVFFQQDVFVM